MQYQSLAHDILTNDILDNFSHILAKQNKICKVVSALFFFITYYACLVYLFECLQCMHCLTYTHNNDS